MSEETTSEFIDTQRKAIKDCRDAFEEPEWMATYGVGIGRLEEACNRLEHLQVELETRNTQVKLQKDRIGELQAALEKYRWIPVGERLPPRYKWVRASNGTMEVKAKRIANNEWFGPQVTTLLSAKIKYWQEIILPESE